jgi:hypothetical protein
MAKLLHNYFRKVKRYFQWIQRYPEGMDWAVNIVMGAAFLDKLDPRLRGDDGEKEDDGVDMGSHLHLADKK